MIIALSIERNITAWILPICYTWVIYIVFELHSLTKLFDCQRLRPFIVSPLARCNDAIFLLRAIRMISMKVWYLTTSSLSSFPGSVPANRTLCTHWIYHHFCLFFLALVLMCCFLANIHSLRIHLRMWILLRKYFMKKNARGQRRGIALDESSGQITSCSDEVTDMYGTKVRFRNHDICELGDFNSTTFQGIKWKKFGLDSFHGPLALHQTSYPSAYCPCFNFLILHSLLLPGYTPMIKANNRSSNASGNLQHYKMSFRIFQQ